MENIRFKEEGVCFTEGPYKGKKTIWNQGQEIKKKSDGTTSQPAPKMSMKWKVKTGLFLRKEVREKRGGGKFHPVRQRRKKKREGVFL